MGKDVGMKREVHSRIVCQVTAEADNVVSISVADTDLLTSEELTVTVDGTPVEPTELTDVHGTRLHRVITPPGELVIAYSAVAEGQSAPAPSEDVDLIRYMRPSRYCPSDVLAPVASGLFGEKSGIALVQAVREWVNNHLSYISGSSGPTDDAVDTYLRRAGVCRDYAHLCITLLRARETPARLAAVYAPGLSPMDFHAVVEAHVDGRWQLIDATNLAPRESMLRIATGRDAADTAFLTTNSGGLFLNELKVTAVADELPTEDPSQLVQLR